MITPISYYQTDIRWRNYDYSAKGESTTIGRAGCGPTCAAMVIATLRDKSVTPKTTADWSLDHGYKALRQGTYHTYFVPQFKVYGIECSRVNTSNIYKSNTGDAISTRNKIKTALANGNWIIACMGQGTWTSSGHYVLAYGINKDGKVLINDPASTSTERRKGNMTTWLNEIKYAWVIIPTVEEDDDVTENRVKELIKEDKRYIKDIKDAPADFQPILKELQTKGILKGTGTEEVGMSYEGVRQIIITYRLVNSLR